MIFSLIGKTKGTLNYKIKLQRHTLNSAHFRSTTAVMSVQLNNI